MGMAASQARFLCLTARKNNVEFHGQQINQQRTALSNQSASYYSELCNMSVPTPPSIDDYTKVSYTFNDGAMTNTITTMIAKGNGEYSLSYLQQWQDDYSIVSASSSLIARTGEAGKYQYAVGSNELRKLGTIPGINNLNEIKAMDDLSYDAFLTTNEFVSKDPYLKTLEKEQLIDLLEQESYYTALLNESNNVALKGEFYVRYAKDSTKGTYTPYFYNADQVTSEGKYSEDGLARESISCFTVGSSTKTKEILNAKGTVETDSTGRYLSITLFQTDEDGNNIKDENGNPITVTYTLTTNTTTDDDAYNDAMNKYNYEQHQYDQKVQDINSKIEIVQQQDKSLELELKQLDTEENAIQTEMEAVKKVISKNVDNSFKTFNA